MRSESLCSWVSRRRVHRGVATPLALALVLTISLSGCSYLFVTEAPPPPVWKSVKWSDCTQSNFLPGLDTTFAVLDGISAIAAAGSGESAALVGALLGTALYGSSAIYGFRHVDRCHGFLRTKGLAEAPAMRLPDAEFGERWLEGRTSASQASAFSSVTD